MLRNRMIRAAIPKGEPIGFVDATEGTGDLGSTGTITVSADDLVIAFSHGKIADEISVYSFGGTSSLSGWSAISIAGDTTGDSGNDYLNICSYATVSTGGTLNMSENGGRDAGYGLFAADGGSSVDHDSGQGGSISVSNVTTDDLVVIYETTQSFGSANLPSTPSGYTSAWSHTFTVGKGGGATYWGSRVSYKTGQSGTVSYTPAGDGDYNGAVIMRIYNP